jgi:hypothetical protein
VRDETEVIFAIDDLAAGHIDLIPNVTRSPLIFEYLQGRFAPKTGIVHPPGYVVLAPRARPVSMPYRPVAFKTHRSGHDLVLRFAQVETCNLLKVTARIVYPLVAALGRHQPLLATLYSRGHPVQHHRLVTLNGNDSFETYLVLNRGASFVHVLEWPDLRKPLPMPLIDELRFQPVALGLFDVGPSQIDMQRIECVALAKDDFTTLQPTYDALVGPLVGGQPVRQDFETVRDMTSGISIFIGTYARIDTGPVTFKVVALEKNGEQILVAIKRDATELLNNEWLTLDFPPQPAGRKLAVIAEAPASTQSNVTLFYAAGDPYRSGQLRIGQRLLDGDLALQVHYKH